MYNSLGLRYSLDHCFVDLGEQFHLSPIFFNWIIFKAKYLFSDLVMWTDAKISFVQVVCKKKNQAIQMLQQLIQWQMNFLWAVSADINHFLVIPWGKKSVA